jgi:hypothetical protein
MLFLIKVRKLLCMCGITAPTVTAVWKGAKLETLEMVNMVLYYIQYLG